MFTKKMIFSFVFLASLLGTTTKDRAEEIKITPIDPRTLSVQEQVVYFANAYGTDSAIALKVMECESNFGHGKVADNGNSRGIYQFQKPTFERMEKLFGEDLDYTSQYDQVKLGTWALANPKLAREWTTWVAIQNGGKYSFHSSQLNKDFTIYCKLDTIKKPSTNLLVQR